MPLPPALAARLAKRGLIQKNEAVQKQGQDKVLLNVGFYV